MSNHESKQPLESKEKPKKMNIFNKLAIIGIVINFLPYSSHSSEDQKASDTSHAGSYKLIKHEEDIKGSSETNSLEEKGINPENSPLYNFPLESNKIKSALEGGATQLRILIPSTAYFHYKTPVHFSSSISLTSICIYYALTAMRQYDVQLVQSLRPLMQSPNLKSIEFTAFLAPEIMPYIGASVTATASFQSYDMKATLPLSSWEDDTRNWLDQLCHEKNWTITIPPKR